MAVSLQLELCLVVVVFAAVQSVFGVGLLVFGTPTLLLLGLPFEQVLAYLLPCSIVISALQVRSGGGLSLEPIRRAFLLFAAPAVLAGTAAVLALGASVHIRPVVGGMLVVTAGIRLLGAARERIEAMIRRRLPAALVVLGLLHGVSNLGGGVLALIVGSVHHDKEEIRKHVAFGYGLMAIVQLVALFSTRSVEPSPGLWLGLPVLSAATFMSVGQRMFRAASHAAFERGLTILVALFGLVLLLAA